MKTLKNNIFVVLMAAALALPVMAQFTTAQEPSTQFQSTSGMKNSGSTYSANPTLNTDGTAAYNDASYEESQQPSGPRKVGPPNPEGDPTPVGNAALPLLVMAFGYAGYILWRKRRLA